MEIKPIARIRNNYNSKFGIPRQSGLTRVLSEIVFEREYRDVNYIKGIEGFSHLWLIWNFSESKDKTSPSVRPPRLGGNEKIGVFATRSPFRPNGLGLSLVELREIKETSDGTVLVVSGADLLNGTPIYDVKPYVEYADKPERPASSYASAPPKKIIVAFECYPDKGFFTDEKEYDSYLDQLVSALSYDPRPAYHTDEDRIYGTTFGDFDVKFKIKEGTLTIIDFIRLSAMD
ncbi:MAG: tRNA (N6-threonylcarbamoyladenosine(37)-N6)-methyltransferase TrmO [Clostridia bacterium]|nr:tRNA (N6-threonylcarbamoyladenosine(37)-N6)-methyltransferase TrmO [Clostridia bacterium]